MSDDLSQSSPWSAILMAGGEARRMGRDKATLVIGGDPLWRRQVRTLHAAGFREIIVARAGRESFDEPGLIEVPDAAPGCGPLGGLVAGLRRATPRSVLVLAVDLPLMPASFLRKMITMTELEGRSVVPSLDGRFEPLAATYSSPCLTFAEELLASQQRSLQVLINRCMTARLMRSFEVSEAERAYFCNVNTPEDLAVVERKPGEV